MAVHTGEFERSIADIETKIEELSKLSRTCSGDRTPTPRSRRQACASRKMRRDAYANLDAWQ